MKTNHLNDPRLSRAVLGRKRFTRHIVTGVPYRESVEYRILQLKKELGRDTKAPKYELFFLGEWETISEERYFELLQTNKTLSENQQFKLRLS